MAENWPKTAINPAVSALPIAKVIGPIMTKDRKPITKSVTGATTNS